MAVAIVVEIIAFLIYLQGTHGQLNSLIKNPNVGQNNLNQGFQSTSSIKSATDNVFQNENFGKVTNFNSQNQINSQQSSIPQSSLSLPLQQTQNFPQLINQQSSQISDLQQQLLYQPQSSFSQQSLSPQSSVIQQPYNFIETPNGFVPVNNVGNINFQQQLPVSSPSMQQVPVQVSHSVPVPNSYVPTYPPISSVPTFGGQPLEFITNLGGNFLAPVGAIPFPVPEGQVISSIPYPSIFSNPNPTTFGNNIFMPYHNQVFGSFDNPFDNQSEIYLDNDVTAFKSDNLTSLLLSLLQIPKKSSKYIQSSYQGNPYSPYTPYKMSQGSKSSSLKALLPVIFNLIKERREGCGCRSDCKCKRKNKNKKEIEPQIKVGYSKKKDYSMKDEMFRTNESEEDIPRITREHKKYKKMKNPISESVESSENDAADYDHLSEEEED